MDSDPPVFLLLFYFNFFFSGMYSITFLSQHMHHGHKEVVRQLVLS